MGMFDTIAWSDSVPASPEMVELGLNKRDWEFQTKDFDCALELYIVQEGKLYIQKHRRTEWIEGDSKSSILSERLGYIESYEPYLEFVPKTITVRMYDYRESVMDAWDCWIEFQTIFKEGIVDSVKLVEFRKESDVPRKEQNQKWKKEYEYQASRWINRYFFYTTPYVKTSTWIRRKLYKLSELIHKFANKI